MGHLKNKKENEKNSTKHNGGINGRESAVRGFGGMAREFKEAHATHVAGNQTSLQKNNFQLYVGRTMGSAV